MDRDMEELFHKDEVRIDADRKRETLLLVKREAAKKKIYGRMPFWRGVTGQLRYLHAESVVGQLICLLLLLAVWPLLESAKRPACDYLALFSVFFAFIGVFMLVEIRRNFSCRLWELEQSCFFNLKQICAARLLLFGGADLVLLTVFILAVGKRAGIGYFRFGIYLIVPFILSQLVYLLAFSCLRNEKELTQYGIAFLTSLLSAFVTRFPKAYERANLWIWCVLLLSAALGMGIQIRKMFKRMEEDGLCWN